MDVEIWTDEHVKTCLVEAFRLVQGIAIYSPRHDVFRRTAIGTDPLPELAPLDLVGMTSRYLGRGSPIRVDLLAWARARGLRGSLAQHCRDFRRGRTSVYANRDRGARLVADGLNRDGVPLSGGCAISSR